MTKPRSSIVNLLGRTGDLIVAAMAHRLMPECPMLRRVWVADQIEGRISTMKDHERERLLALVSKHLASGDDVATINDGGVKDLLAVSMALVEKVIDRALDPFELDLHTRYGRIHLTLDWEERRRGRASVQFIKVKSRSACAAIAHARLHGFLHRIGEPDLALTAEEWRWLYGSEVSCAVRGASKREW